MISEFKETCDLPHQLNRVLKTHHFITLGANYTYSEEGRIMKATLDVKTEMDSFAIKIRDLLESLSKVASSVNIKDC